MTMRPSRSARRAHPAAHQRPARLAALLVVVCGVLAYANSIHGPFIFDDRRAVLENPTIRELWSISAVLHPPGQTPVAGRPISNLSFAINYAAGGVDVAGYHIWNIGVHILAALALLGILRMTRPWAAPDADRTTTDRLALVCALVWVLHPLNSEAVNYLTQRTESMVGLFYLLTVYAAITAHRALRPRRWALAGIVANFCGIATKESMVTAPLMVLLWDRVFVYRSFQHAFSERRRFYFALAAGWILFGILSLETPFFSDTGFRTRVSPWTYLLNQAPIIVRYLRLSVWPSGLVLDYGLPLPLTIADVWPSGLLLLALVVATGVALARAPRLGFWGAWFFITLAPASSVLPIPTEAGAERRMYLPLIAVIMVVVPAAWWLLRWGPAAERRLGVQSREGITDRLFLGVAAVVLFSLGVATLQRNSEYRSGVSIWSTVLERRPHARAHTNLAAELKAAGQSDQALTHLKLAASEDPDAQYLLGSALIELGNVREAVPWLQRFVSSNPTNPYIASARQELADALYREGRLAEAIAQQEIVVSSNPNHAVGRLNLAKLLMAANDFNRAAVEYREYLRQEPGNLAAATGLGIALASAGRTDEAVEAFRQASRIDSRDVAAKQGLVETLLRTGRVAEAEQEARAVVGAFPDDAIARYLLGVTLEAQGRIDAAVMEFEAAAKSAPQWPQPREALKRVLNEPAGTRTSGEQAGQKR
jgi:tetratricopeptide (TPR) repeat protein